MNIFKRIASKILAKELEAMNNMAIVPLQTTQQFVALRDENEALRQESFGLARMVRMHEKRINEMAPEKQFTVKAVDGTVLQQEMVYSSAGFTVLTVRLPLGHPWKQATELAQQLELANIEVDKARDAMGMDPIIRRRFLGLDPARDDNAKELPPASQTETACEAPK